MNTLTENVVAMINAKLLQLVVDASNDGIVVAEQEGDDNILIYVNNHLRVCSILALMVMRSVVCRWVSQKMR